MKFARDVSTRIFFMYDGYIHEDGSPEQVFTRPRRSATKAFVQRIRKEVFEVDGEDFDFLGMETRINCFCLKYNRADKKDAAIDLIHLLLPVYLESENKLTVRLTHSELSGETTLDFMQEDTDSAPLPVREGSVREQILTLCKSVVEEPTTRGFRVKLLL
jgi:ABC-type sulfate/molybdate transport systems ATPase subunit